MSTIKPSATSLDQPILVGIKTVAKLLGRSEQSIRRDDHAGRIPRSVAIGGSKKWDQRDLRHWIRAGCPARDAWEASRQAQP